MTDELLGELAARMKLIADALPQHKLSALQALGLARECVRQMEWAAEKAFKVGRTSGFNQATWWPNEVLSEQKHGPVLTLAPEDWTP
jgi:hypothetical protein